MMLFLETAGPNCGGIEVDRSIERHKFPLVKFGSLYLVSYGLMLFFLRTYFWDDWYIYFGRTDKEIENLLRQHTDLPIRSFIELNIFGNRPELFHLGILVCYFLAGWCLFHILGTLKFLGNAQIEIITILFLVLPINSARVAMINLAYGLSLASFFAGWYFLVTKKSWMSACIAFILFICSFFSTASMLVFFMIPVAHRAYLSFTQTTSIKTRVILFSSAWAFTAPLYWFVSRRFFPPQGAYLVMYSLQKSGIMRALILLILCCVIIAWYSKIGLRDVADSNRYLLICIGIVITAIGAAPYIVAGHLVDASEWMLNFVPRASQWDSRHQLLLGLGLSTLIVGILGEIDSTFKRRLVRVLIGMFVLLNLTYMHSYFLDSMKQKEVMSAIEGNSEMKDSRVIMIHDLTTDRYNARGRDIRSYEWDAMFSSIYNDNLRKSIDGYDFVDCASGQIPDTLLTINATNGRFKATLLRQVGINISVTRIAPCP
jgi:hypothetical protein